MNFRTLAAALVLVATSTPAFAGSWAYGCVGTLSKGSNIMFNRSQLVISSTELESSKLLNIESDDISTFDADDVNSGFDRKMTFSKKWDGGTVQTLTVTPISSKSIGNKNSDIPCTASRAREVSTDITMKKLQILLPGETKPTVTTLKCYEHIVSTCG